MLIEWADGSGIFMDFVVADRETALKLIGEGPINGVALLGGAGLSTAEAEPGTQGGSGPAREYRPFLNRAL